MLELMEWSAPLSNRLQKSHDAVLDDAAQISELITPLVERFICHEFSSKAQAIMLNSMSKQQIRENIEDSYTYYMAYEQGKKQLAGILGLFNDNHLYHLFVKENYHKHGVAKQLWQYLLTKTDQKIITVNSSRFALNFYQKLGFQPDGAMKEKDGISYFPMQFDRS